MRAARDHKHLQISSYVQVAKTPATTTRRCDFFCVHPFYTDTSARCDTHTHTSAHVLLLLVVISAMYKRALACKMSSDNKHTLPDITNARTHTHTREELVVVIVKGSDASSFRNRYHFIVVRGFIIFIAELSFRHDTCVCKIVSNSSSDIISVR